MSGVQGAFVHHVVRRGLSAAQEHFQSGPSEETMNQLQHDAGLYEAAGPEKAINPMEMLPVVLTGIVMLLLVASVCQIVSKRGRAQD